MSSTAELSPKTANPLDLIDLKLAQEIFRVGPQTIRRWTSNGLLPKAIALGRKRFWRRSDLVRAVAAAERAGR
jgi:hypothetical protein